MRRVKKYLSRDSLITLVHAFITSRLDYCNGLLFGLPKAQIAKLQRLQNAAARLIPKGEMLTTWDQDHFQQLLRNSGMAYQWSFVKQHHLTVLNLDLKPIFLRSIFIVCNLVYFILTVMYFRFLLNI